MVADEKDVQTAPTQLHVHRNPCARGIRDEITLFPFTGISPRYCAEALTGLSALEQWHDPWGNLWWTNQCEHTRTVSAHIATRTNLPTLCLLLVRYSVVRDLLLLAKQTSGPRLGPQRRPHRGALGDPSSATRAKVASTCSWLSRGEQVTGMDTVYYYRRSLSQIFATGRSGDRPSVVIQPRRGRPASIIQLLVPKSFHQFHSTFLNNKPYSELTFESIYFREVGCGAWGRPSAAERLTAGAETPLCGT